MRVFIEKSSILNVLHVFDVRERGKVATAYEKPLNVFFATPTTILRDALPLMHCENISERKVKMLCGNIMDGWEGREGKWRDKTESDRGGS